MEFLKIKYRNSCDLAGSLFTATKPSFSYVIYLNVDVGKSIYEYTEEGRDDGEKNFIPDFKKLAKVYEFTTLVPEYILDCLYSIMLHDTIVITLKNDETSRVRNFKVQQNGWNDFGSMCNVTVQFTVDYVISTGCCGNEKLTFEPCKACEPFTIAKWDTIFSEYYTNPNESGINAGNYCIFSKILPTDNLIFRWHIQRGWVQYMANKLDCISFTYDGINYKLYYDGEFWQPMQFIRDAVKSGTSVTVRCWMRPNSFGQLYKSTDGVTYTAVGIPTTSGTMQNAGVTAVGLAGTVYFKVLMYDNNCTYGYSNVVSVAI